MFYNIDCVNYLQRYVCTMTAISDKWLRSVCKNATVRGEFVLLLNFHYKLFEKKTKKTKSLTDGGS